MHQQVSVNPMERRFNLHLCHPNDPAKSLAAWPNVDWDFVYQTISLISQDTEARFIIEPASVPIQAIIKDQRRAA